MMLADWQKRILLDNEKAFLSQIKKPATVELANPPVEGMAVRAASGPFGIIDFEKYFDSGPLIQYGSATGPNTATWYRVTFSKRFATIPKVTATALYRPGTQPKKVYTAPVWVAPTFNAPKFTAPHLTAPTISINIPTWNMPDYRQDIKDSMNSTYLEFMKKVADKMHDAIDADPIKWAANGLRKFIYGEDTTKPPWQYSVYSLTAWAWETFSGVMGDKFWDLVARVIPDNFTRFRDQVQKSVNDSLGAYRDKINTQTDTFKTNLQDQMDAYNQQMRDQMNAWSASLQTAVNQLTKLAENSVNSAIDILYEHIGLPQNATITVCQLRNITVDGFDFLSQGNMEINWLALAQ